MLLASVHTVPRSKQCFGSQTSQRWCLLWVLILAVLLGFSIFSESLFLLNISIHTILSALYIRLFAGCHNGVTLWRALPSNVRRELGQLVPEQYVSSKRWTRVGKVLRWRLRLYSRASRCTARVRAVTSPGGPETVWKPRSSGRKVGGRLQLLARMTDTRRRVKVYTLNEDRQWDDRGTGHVSSGYVERLKGTSLLVRAESDGKPTRRARFNSEITCKCGASRQ